MLDYEFGDGTYLVAVNYGPDSMALLDMMMNNGVSPVVCHINYHLNEENEIDEQKLAVFCQEKGLRLEVRDARFMNQDGRDDDFAKWSREARYGFFSEIYKKYDACALFLAHQQDDIIENYLLLKKLGISKAKYGRSKISTSHGMIVVRPLLQYIHEDLINYCNAHNVPYSLGASDFEESHLRSEIRREVDRMNEVERDQIIDEMNRKQNDEISFAEAFKGAIRNHDDLNIRSLIALSWEEYVTSVTAFLNRNAKKKIKISEKLLKDLRAMCLNGKENDTLKIKDDIYFVKEYDVIFVDNDGLNMPYSYVLKEPCAFSCPSFDLDFSKGAEDRHIHESDYPLTVRSVLPQDTYVFGGHLVPVKPLLVAAGITNDMLKIWPVFLNKDGKIIYVPRYDKSFKEYHTSKLVIHTEINQ